MRLTRLELLGYKSFANKTEFAFPEGITAIVGPNGSGKSNIADALRWVLGEQSQSALRTKRTEDLIFAGSEGRARQGMAEVVITLDNADAILPIAFTEVTITRRVYRSGESEVLLNGARVRLRDVLELLAHSDPSGLSPSGRSLSRSAYVVIGQGLVDQALALRPDERRQLIDEAAGIRPYQAKRDSTLARLDETEANLRRVHDILAEITPRLRRLERHAERAYEHARLSARLQEVLTVWHGYQWHHVQEQLTLARQRQADLAGELARVCFAEQQVLAEEREAAAEALVTRDLVERARRILMARDGLTEAEAFQRIHRASRASRRSMRATAEAIIAAASPPAET
jgi:chromosome segregation protein